MNIVATHNTDCNRLDFNDHVKAVRVSLLILVKDRNSNCFHPYLPRCTQFGRLVRGNCIITSIDIELKFDVFILSSETHA